MFRLLRCPLSLLLVIVLLLPLDLRAIDLAVPSAAAPSLQPARNSYAAGQHGAALSFLRSYLLDYPESPYVSEAHMLMARVLLSSQRAEDALFYLQRPAVDSSNENRLLQVIALQRQGWMDEAERQLATLTAAVFAGADQQLFFQARATSLLHRQQPLQALEVVRTALSAADSAGSVLVKIGEQALENLDPAARDEAEFMFAGTAIADLLTLQRARLAMAGGNVQLARQLLETLMRTGQAVAVLRSAAEQLDALAGQRWYQQAIGVVLPLSGRYAPFGELVRQGLELAIAEQAALQPEHGPLRYIFLDSQADAAQAAAAVATLIEAHRVLAVIGPLTKEAARAAAPVAEAAQVPLLSLSHQPGLPELGAYVFRHSLTSHQQVRALADYAIDVLGLNNYAILYPDSGSGAEFAEQFTAEITALGGDVVHCLSFAEEATDFRRQLMQLKGLDPDAPSDELAVEPPPEQTSTMLGLPTVDFEALFVPAYAESVALLAPQLAYYGIENVQLLGINGWNSPLLIQQAGRYTKGAIFSEGFFAASDDPQVMAFVAAYQSRFGEAPSILEAQGYDCAGIIHAAMGVRPATSPQALSAQLLAVNDYRGVSGLLGFDGNGEARRQVSLLKMERRRLQQLAIPLPVTVAPSTFGESSGRDE